MTQRTNNHVHRTGGFQTVIPNGTKVIVDGEINGMVDGSIGGITGIIYVIQTDTGPVIRAREERVEVRD